MPTTPLRLATLASLLLLPAATPFALPTTSAGVAPQDVLDFEDLQPGTVVSEVFGAAGTGPVLVRGTNPNLGDDLNAAVVFDSAAPTGFSGIDFDLGTPNIDFQGPGIGSGGSFGSAYQNDVARGHLLIIDEHLIDGDGDGLIDEPDDANLMNVVLVLDFAEVGSATLHALTIVDAENPEDAAAVEFFDAELNPIGGVVLLPKVGNNGVAMMDLGDVAGVHTMRVTLGGSGAIDDIVFTAGGCTGAIGNCVWNDLDCDGLQDPGEPGIPGVPLSLYTSDGLPVGRAVTDADGKYLFTGLCAGDYFVIVREGGLPDGFVPSLCNVGDDDTIDNDCNPGRVCLATDDTVDLNVDFGFKGDCSGSIGNFVWDDVDCDGLQDPDEPGLANVLVVLKNATGSAIASATTDAQGLYLFTGLCAGEYVVVVVEDTLPDGAVATVCDAGDDDTLDNDCSPAVVILPFDDSVDDTTDFGFKQALAQQGCTPGYWKQPQHFDSWPARYTPDTLFGDVFEDAFPRMTLVQVAAQGGGQIKALGRHTVAALLNAASDQVHYGLSAQQVIGAFNAAHPGRDYEGLKHDFESKNESGCPLN